MTSNNNELLDLVGRFGGLKVLVYGDFVLDEFLYGQIDRISREAPVFIVAHQSSDFRPGCAANAVANLAALGAEPIPCGVIGHDEAGEQLRSIFNFMGVDSTGLSRDAGVTTALKTRVIAGSPHSKKQQIVRIDRLQGASAGAQADRAVRARLQERIEFCDAVLISDYGIGGLTPETGRWLVDAAREAGKPVLADSRYRLLDYAGVTAATPNEPEAEESSGIRIAGLNDLYNAGKELTERLGCEALVITRGGEGMSLFRKDKGVLDIPPFGDDEVGDVTGAGDTVIAAFALGIAAGGGFELAARLANVAGGLTVLKKGTSTVSPKEIAAALGKG